MTGNHSNFIPQAHVVPFITPLALLLDACLTPVERNAWQVLRMLRAVDGRSALASLAQLRPYLTTTPLGQRAGYETAWRALIVLRLTGWKAPAAGGPTARSLTADQRALDMQVRQTIRRELGHERTQITAVYLGR
ncbi:hypothetical protein V2T44_11310 [Serratia ficaria]|uniref:Uncharacterized protein n=1 Tax=Serratia ficaria TaxID=61651 RepID=A0A240CF57_SERFI|nr:hypothetical protein [Serratia ficaria]MEE4483530.1 hypothetical protein [Serratia ficaria]REF42547.1 hypothetical protein C7332_0737 [Serratia ficaria]CAI1079109.1 Uncharacterised protein [Serratia ficaria]CAI1080325.1 Uncharacterised protein [Serratia ficaria]CAI1082593.1 Uncharacterised protein [Serratia ficaria]